MQHVTELTTLSFLECNELLWLAILGSIQLRTFSRWRYITTNLGLWSRLC